MSTPLEVFCCYAREDQEMLMHLKKHLMPLQRQGRITIWSDTNLNAGAEWEKELHQHLESADIFLLLISADFMASDYCYGIEMQRAIERHDQGSAHVVPVLLRSTFWQNAPFAKLQMVPTNAEPVTRWSNPHDAFHNITEQINRVITEHQTEQSKPSLLPKTDQVDDPSGTIPNRSSDFALSRTHTTQTDQSVSMPAPATKAPPISRRTVLLIGAVGIVTLAAVGTGAFIISHPHPSPDRSMAQPSRTVTPQASSRATQNQSFIYRGHSNWVRSVAWSPDGKHIASGGEDKTVQVWDASNGNLLFTYKDGSPVSSVSWSPDSKLFVSGGGGQRVQVWNASNGDGPLGRYPDGHPGTVYAVAWSPDDNFIADGGRGSTVWPSIGGKPQFTYWGHSDNDVLSVAWSPDSKRIAEAIRDQTVQVWDATASSNPLTCQGHTSEVLSVAWSHNGLWLASAGGDQTVRVWNAHIGGNPLYTYRARAGAVNAVAWSHDDQRLASANGDGTVQTWDALSEGKNLRNYLGHTGEVYGVSWFPDSKRITSGGADTTVRVWKV